MMHPGRTADLPNSSGSVNGKISGSGDILGFPSGKPLVAVDGFVVTLAMMASLILIVLMWQLFIKKGRRR